MAVGINTLRAILCRYPSVLAEENITDADGSGVAMEVGAFVWDLCGYSIHRDRSAMVAGRSFANMVRATAPGLLRGRDRGRAGARLARSGRGAPATFGSAKGDAGVRGADLLWEYEKNKERAQAREEGGDGEDGGWEEAEEEEAGGEHDMDGWEKVGPGDDLEPEEEGTTEEEDEEEEEKETEIDMKEPADADSNATPKRPPSYPSLVASRRTSPDSSPSPTSRPRNAKK